MQILGLSGKKQSGKTTASNFILGRVMKMLNLIQGHFYIDNLGRLNVSDLFGDDEGKGIFDPYNPKEQVQTFLSEYVDPVIRLYSFADALKQDVCINLLGLTWKQCYGTDEDKNSLTKFSWEDMPGFDSYCISNNISVSGKMSAREIMQYVGSEIFREMYPNIWVDVLLRRVKNYGSMLSVITDCRFPNECDAIHEAGGQILRMTRSPFSDQDTHMSETELDQYDNFDMVLFNDTMTVDEQCVQLNKLLIEKGYFQEV